MKTMTALLTKEDDMFIAKCPELGTISQGASIEEAVANLKEATELYLQEFHPQISSGILLTNLIYISD